MLLHVILPGEIEELPIGPLGIQPGFAWLLDAICSTHTRVSVDVEFPSESLAHINPELQAVRFAMEHPQSLKVTGYQPAFQEGSLRLGSEPSLWN